ncbi:Hpt domain-containing protein [Thiorhodospira sibirica]|uniref:hybrid sensor histidine kinase/response regulator n=1 Tax=Thiorhodospira sibirica TaxID=154347 RepID=UPI00022C39CA|nr:Hpt domain-containing protein [Thiorhodospira sibirica]
MTQDASTAYNPLHFVRQELDALLDETRAALECYLEDTHQTDRLYEALLLLNQGHGVLQMLELSGAAMLVQEMALLLDSVRRGEVTQPDDAFEALMRGILQLPDYLEHIQMGHQDAPIVLLPLLNDLRTLRNVSPLSAHVLFFPDIQTVKVPQAQAAVPSGPMPELAKRARSAFQLSLLGVLRNEEVDTALRRMVGVFDHLFRAAAETPSRRLFWIGGALAESLAQQGLALDATVKQLLSHIDRALRLLTEEGEAQLARSVSAELIKTLLYYIARSTSEGPRVRSVKQAFRLHDLLPQGENLQMLMESIRRPNLALLSTVSQAIREDLTEVKDMLDMFMHSSQRPVDELLPLVGRLKRIADTLEMLGMQETRELALREARIIEGLTQSQQLDERLLMQAAGEMLNIEAAINTLLASRRAPSPYQQTLPETLVGMSAGESRAVVLCLLQEMRQDMDKAKALMLGFYGRPEQFALLAEVPVLLNGVRGALAILNLQGGAELLATLQTAMQGLVLCGPDGFNETTFNTLADAITGLDFYLEALAEGHDDPDIGLAFLRESLAHLSASSPRAAVATAVPESDAASVSAYRQDQLGVLAMSQPTTTFPAEYAVLAGDADPEILEVFQEEVQEEIERLYDYVPRWRVNTSDEQALHTIRRSFHTLKGSGRLVGAQLIGEFSYALEYLLGRVIDKSLSPSPALFELLDEALATLPKLVAQLEHADSVPLPRACELIISARTLAGIIPAAAKTTEDDSPAVTSAAATSDTPDSSAEVSATTAPAEATAEEAPTPHSESLILGSDLEDAPFVLMDTQPPQVALSTRDHAEPPSDLGNINRDAATLGEADAEAAALLEVSPEAAAALATPAAPAPWDAEHPPGSEKATLSPPAPTPQMDAGLFDIFRNETEQHLQTLSVLLEDSIASLGDLPIKQEFLRALHTLNGSARTAEVPSISVVCAPIERYAKARAEVGLPFPDTAFPLLQQVITYIRQVLAALASTDTPIPQNPELQQAIDQLLETELKRQEHDHAAWSAVESWLKPLPELTEPASHSHIAYTAPAPTATKATPAPPPPPASPETPPAAAAIPAAPIPATPADVAQPVAAPEASAPAVAPAAEVSPAHEPNQPYDEDQELVDIFLEEGVEILEKTEQILQAWSMDLGSRDIITDLQRQLHTLKGSSRMAGFTHIGTLSHSVETLMIAVSEGQRSPDKALLNVIHLAMDSLSAMLEQAQKKQPIYPDTAMVVLLEGVRSGQAATTTHPPAGASPPTIAVPGAHAPGKSEPVGETVATPDRGDTATKGANAQELVRVRSDVLDNLVNYAGEVNIYHSRLEQQITSFGFNLAEFAQTVLRLREQLRKLEMETESQILFRHEALPPALGAPSPSSAPLNAGHLPGSEKPSETPTAPPVASSASVTQASKPTFDPLEMDRYSNIQQLSRALAESVSDLSSIQEILAEQVRDTETLLLQQSRISTDLQEGLMRTRMVQFGTLTTRLRRIVRQTSGELGKQAELFIDGEHSELDRSVLERMIAPLEHMLRNAISHGIEAPDIRAQRSKPPVGSVRLRVNREGSEVVIQVQDDGGGISVELVRAKAIKLGLLSPAEVLPDQEIMQFILESGFSTAQKVSQIAGRGVGMDVVNTEIKQLGGVMSIDTVLGQGTTFTIRLPFTLAINQALLVQAGEDIYAIALSSIEGIVRIRTDELTAYYQSENPLYPYAGHRYEVKHLGALLGVSQPRLLYPQAMFPMMLVRSGENRIALQVDSLLGSREVVVKPVGPQIGKVKGISGATILGDGRVILILDIPALVRMGSGLRLDYRQALAPANSETSIEMAIQGTVMVVDDSITIRKVTSRMLKRHHYEVLTAKDGLDAVAQLQESLPDIILLDIEMPRMDGYELASHIRNDSRLRHLPIIMVTSRTGEKHRARALEIGVNRYLAKPYQEADLLQHVQTLLKERPTALAV